MDDPATREQAELIGTLLRALLRELGAGVMDPVAELPLAQLRVCSLLCAGPRPMSALSRELGVSLSAITQLADRLERAGLAARILRGNDRRVRRLQLTERGEQLIRLHDEVRMQRIAAALERLPLRVRKDAASVLRALTRAVADARMAAEGRGADTQEKPFFKVLP